MHSKQRRQQWFCSLQVTTRREFFKAADLEAEKKLRIKTVTEELVGAGAEQEKKLVVWFTNDERGLGSQQDQQPHPARRIR